MRSLVIGLTGLAALSLVGGAAVATTPPGTSPAAARGVVASTVVQVPGRGAVEISLPTPRTVTVARQDPATGAWGAPRTVYRAERGVTCGDVDAQASPGGVAVLVECDTPYYEDQAPVHSVALVSRDLQTYAVRRLRGEAYRQPGISPTGAYAVWLAGANGAYVAWSAATGFAQPARTAYRGRTGGETAVVDDAGTVTVIGAEGLDERLTRCGIGISARTAAGVSTHTFVAGVEVGCSDTTFAAVDATTVLGGYDRPTQLTLTRGADGTWSRTRIAPSEAPGLARFPRRSGIPAQFLVTSDPAKPVVSIGSPDRRQVLAQVYDEATQTWGPTRLIGTTSKPCASAFLYVGDPRGVYAWAADCGRRTTLAVSPDARTWTVSDVGRRAWSLYGDDAALPDATGTTVVTPQATERFAGLTTGSRCDAVWSGRPGELVRLHGRPHRWPTRVQVSTGGPWTTVSTVRAPARPGCQSTFADTSATAPVLTVTQTGFQRGYQPVLRDGVWKLVAPRY